MTQAQFDPRMEFHANVWEKCDLFFNIVFLIELLLNMYGSWFWRFWRNSWNVFDFLVVFIGMLDACNVRLPPPLTLLRMFRAFRVFRLFKRVESLAEIIKALLRAVPGVVSAFTIMFLVMAVYALLGVDVFIGFGEG